MCTTLLTLETLILGKIFQILRKLKRKIHVLLYMFTSFVKQTFVELPIFLVDAESTETKSKHNDNLIRITQRCTPDFVLRVNFYDV